MITLQDWIKCNKPSEDMNYSSAAWSQIFFVRDELAPLVGSGLDYDAFTKANIARVISSHRSKSIKVPVYELTREDLGLRIILRNNFYNWKLSVISEKPIACDFSGLFHTSPPTDPDYTGDPLAHCYFEGFSAELVYGYYEEGDGREWSAELRDDHRVWMTVFLILRSMGVIKKLGWSQRP